MSEHYYSANPTSGHHYQSISIELRGINLKLTTDTGVFSKSKLDTGTKLLINSVPIETGVEKILDLGCGYGPIGLMMAKLFPNATIYMSDLNERAVELAIKNAVDNGITNVKIKAGEGFEPFAGEQFDLILTNPPIRAGKQVIYPLMEQAHLSLRDNGWLAAVIMTKQGAKSLEKKMVDIFGNVSEWEKGSGYRVFASRK